MRFAELLLLAVGLSMDAFAVSLCKGLAIGKIRLKHALTVGAWFGGFQALMPLAGYFLGAQFSAYIAAFDHWVAFVLLGAIGANMIREAFSRDDAAASTGASLAFGAMLTLAVATSIDALAVGVSFAFLSVDIARAAGVIGVTTFILSAAGVCLGAQAGSRYEKRAELLGGVILVLLGFKILLEHLGIL